MRIGTRSDLGPCWGDGQRTVAPQVTDIFLAHYEGSCTWDKEEAIVVGETGPYEEVLARGLAISSVLPHVVAS